MPGITFTGPGTEPKAELLFTPTQGAVGRAVAALILSSLAMYFLHTGRRDNDVGRLLWAALCGLATLCVFLF